MGRTRDTLLVPAAVRVEATNSPVWALKPRCRLQQVRRCLTYPSPLTHSFNTLLSATRCRNLWAASRLDPQASLDGRATASSISAPKHKGSKSTATNERKTPFAEGLNQIVWATSAPSQWPNPSRYIAAPAGTTTHSAKHQWLPSSATR